MPSVVFFQAALGGAAAQADAAYVTASAARTMRVQLAVIVALRVQKRVDGGAAAETREELSQLVVHT